MNGDGAFPGVDNNHFVAYTAVNFFSDPRAKVFPEGCCVGNATIGKSSASEFCCMESLEVNVVTGFKEFIERFASVLLRVVVEDEAIVPVFSPRHSLWRERCIHRQRRETIDVFGKGAEHASCCMVRIVLRELLVLREPLTAERYFC